MFTYILHFTSNHYWQHLCLGTFQEQNSLLEVSSSQHKKLHDPTICAPTWLSAQWHVTISQVEMRTDVQEMEDWHTNTVARDQISVNNNNNNYSSLNHLRHSESQWRQWKRNMKAQSHLLDCWAIDLKCSSWMCRCWTELNCNSYDYEQSERATDLKTVRVSTEGRRHGNHDKFTYCCLYWSACEWRWGRITSERTEQFA